MRRHTSVLVTLVLLSACSGEHGKQTASAAAMGAALGIPGGPIGVAVGTVVGAAAGAIMPEGSFQPSETTATQ